jgi:hypothetical protein
LKKGQEGYTGYLGEGGRIILKRIVQTWDKTNRTDMGSRGGGLALSGLGKGPVGGFVLNESSVSVKKKAKFLEYWLVTKRCTRCRLQNADYFL